MYEASEKQINYIISLAGSRGVELSVDFDTLTGKEASTMIENLMAMPKAFAVVEEGMYRKGDAIFRVKRSLSGNLYAMRLNVIEMAFEYEAGAISKLTKQDKMTLEEAKAFGVETGFCCVCARFLTDEKSVANGIGPVCAKKV